MLYYLDESDEFHSVRSSYTNVGGCQEVILAIRDLRKTFDKKDWKVTRLDDCVLMIRADHNGQYISRQFFIHPNTTIRIVRFNYYTLVVEMFLCDVPMKEERIEVK